MSFYIVCLLCPRFEREFVIKGFFKKSVSSTNPLTVFLSLKVQRWPIRAKVPIKSLMTGFLKNRWTSSTQMPAPGRECWTAFSFGLPRIPGRSYITCWSVCRLSSPFQVEKMGYKKIPPVPIHGSGMISFVWSLCVSPSMLKKIMNNFWMDGRNWTKFSGVAVKERVRVCRTPGGGRCLWGNSWRKGCFFGMHFSQSKMHVYVLT